VLYRRAMFEFLTETDALKSKGSQVVNGKGGFNVFDGIGDWKYVKLYGSRRMTL